MKYKEESKKHENKILRFLKKLKFKDVNGGESFRIGGHQIDVCAGHQNTLLIFECTTQQDINSKITSFRGKLNDIIHGFKKNDTYKKYTNYRYIIVVKYQNVTDTHRKHGLQSKGHTVYIWDNNFIKYYENLFNMINEYAKYNLLAEIDIKPVKEEKTEIPTLVTTVGTKNRNLLFLFFIEAKELLKFAYVARRELRDESYYQRILKANRLDSIANYINKGKIFPNSIVVALEDNCWDFDTVNIFNSLKLDTNLNWLQFGKLTLKNNYRSCWIIDGQHRLFSFTKTTIPGYLAVSAFAKTNKSIQADYFLDINREAKPVDPNLLWDLLGSLSPNSKRGIISNSVKQLYYLDGIFKENIKIPAKGSGKLSFNNLCSSLEKNELVSDSWSYDASGKRKNPYLSKDYKSFQNNLANGLNHFFNSLKSGLKPKINKILESDGFLSVMITIFKLLSAHMRKKLQNQDLNSFFTPLCEYLNQLNSSDIEKVKKGLSSEGGKLDFRNIIIRLARENFDKDFAPGLIKKEPSLAEKIQELEFLLNEFVNSILEKEIGKDWLEKNLRDLRQLKICKEQSERKGRPSWEFLNFQTTINNIILENQLWGRFFKNIFVSHNQFSNRDELITASKALWDYRSDKKGHFRSKPVIYSPDKERIIRSYHNIFLSIINNHKKV
jgi:DGQHR domain-containing protein